MSNYPKARGRWSSLAVTVSTISLLLSACSSPADRVEQSQTTNDGSTAAEEIRDVTVAGLIEEVKGLADLDALEFFESLANRDLTDQQIIEFFVNLPVSDANEDTFDLYNSRGFANGATMYPAAEMVENFEWAKGMGTEITGPFTGQELKLPFSDEYIPLAPGPIGDADRTYVVGLVSGGLSDAWIANYQDSIGYVADQHPNVTLDIRDYNFDMTRYVTEVDSLIAAGVDAIITWPMVESSSAPPLQRAEEAGIPVITADRTTGYPDVTARITGNFPANGAQNGMYLIWKLAQETGGESVEGNVIVLGKPAGSTADLIRGGYFLKVLSYFPNVNILKYENVDDGRQPSVEAAQNVFAAYDDIDAVIGLDSNKAAVSVQAAEQAGKMTRKNGEQLIILSTDDAKEIFGLIDDGKISVNTPYTPLMGDIQMRVTLKILAGEQVPQDVATPNLPMVTKNGDVIFGLQTQTPAEWFPYTFG